MALKSSGHIKTALGFQSLIWQIGDQLGRGETVQSASLPNEEVLRGFVHDIKSPLSVLGMLKPQIQKMDGELAQLIQTALAQIESLSGRLNRLERTSQETVQKSEEGFGLEELVQSLSKMMSAKSVEYKGQGVFLARVDLEVQNMKMPGSLAEWESILSNILNNSVEHSQSFCRVWIELKVVGKALTIEVFDTGRGLLEEQLDSFNSGHTWSSKGVQGGLGLKQAINYTKSFEGEIIFRNRQSGGLSLKITLPLQNK